MPAHVVLSRHHNLTGFSMVLTGGRGMIDIYVETMLIANNDTRREAIVALVKETAEQLEQRLKPKRKEQ
jgi:hypothetical protein